MKKYLIMSSPFLLSTFTISLVTSCGGSESDFKTMSWTIDIEKVNILMTNTDSINSFNSEAISADKLKKIIKIATNVQDNKYDLDRYTSNAISEGWFESISINEQTKKLTIKLKSSLEINGKTKICPYRLPNNQLEMTV
ncbi:MAG: hypothetical protein HDR43_00220 [Mycoplasma sp.]|nr:hypothetical protein [Mycoplasma sp.]